MWCSVSCVLKASLARFITFFALIRHARLLIPSRPLRRICELASDEDCGILRVQRALDGVFRPKTRGLLEFKISCCFTHMLIQVFEISLQIMANQVANVSSGVNRESVLQ